MIQRNDYFMWNSLAYRSILEKKEDLFVYHAAISRATPEIIRFHRRAHHQIGHMSPEKLMDAIKLEAIDGVPSELTSALIHN